MIYDQESSKYIAYLRPLSVKEKVMAAYQHERDAAERKLKKETMKEEKRWYANWDDALPAIMVDTMDLRDKIHARKYRQQHDLE